MKLSFDASAEAAITLTAFSLTIEIPFYKL
jgi:hypothetical protein